MCLSTVYQMEGDKKTVLLDRVAQIRTNNGQVELEDLVGRNLSFQGRILSVDLLENEIIVQTDEKKD